MDQAERFIKIYGHWLLFGVFALLFLIFTVLHFSLDANCYPRLSSFVGGLAAAFLVATIQFFIQLYEQKTLSKFRKHGVKDFLTSRDDKKYYGGLIAKTKKDDVIKVLGVTASRMLQDFADLNELHSQELVKAMGRGVKVEILLPKSCFLSQEQKDDLVNKTLVLATSVSGKYSNLFEIRFFNNPPSHSMFFCGDVCLIGPVFEGKHSRNTPAIIFDSRGEYVIPYLSNFNNLWGRAGQDHE